MTGRHALIVATYDYRDAGLKRLVAPRHDAESLAEVLADREIAGFTVTTLVNEPHHVVGEAIGDFFAARRRDELSLLYFTGHGLKDDEGRLFLAMANTRRDQLLFSALSAQSINDAMNGCRSREKVLILDCCYSGAFPGGYTAKADTAVNTLERFTGGRGKVVLTASDATQYSFEGNQLRGVGSASVFTRHLVEGLRTGAADQDEDGDIALDELYTYVYERVVAEMPQQRPKKQDDVEGRIVIAHNIRWDLPGYVRSGLASPIPGDRLHALTNLARLHANGNPAVRARVIARLTELLDDDSKQVSQAAAELLRRCAPVAAEAEMARRQAEEQQRREAEEAEWRRQQAAETAAEERAAAERQEHAAATEQRPRLATENGAAGEAEQQPQTAGSAGLLDRSPRERPTADDVADPSPYSAAQDGSSTAAAFSGTSLSGDDARRDPSLNPHGPASVINTAGTGTGTGPGPDRLTASGGGPRPAAALPTQASRSSPASSGPVQASASGSAPLPRPSALGPSPPRRRRWLIVVAALALAAVAVVATLVWSTGWTTPNVERQLTGHTGPVEAVATAQLNGRPVTVSGSDDGTVRVWDLATGKPVGDPFTGHTDSVNAVATAQLDGRPVVISGSGAATVRVWDLATGQLIGAPFAGHTRSVEAVATAQLDGRPVAVSGGDDQTVRVWDLATRQPVGAPFTGHTGYVNAVATAQLDGRPVVISGSTDQTVRVWDLATGQSVGAPFSGHTSSVNAVATAQLDGRPVIISGSDDQTVRVWDLATGNQIEAQFTGHTGAVRAVATAQLDGRPVVISGSADKTVRVWDLATGKPVGAPFIGHTGWVTAVATTQLDGRPVVISGSGDQTVRVWDLAARAHS